MKKDKMGVSAIIGVILMVAITVAIAGTVYVYISGMIDKPMGVNLVVEGSVDSIYQRGLDNYTVVILDHVSYALSNPLSFFDGVDYGDNIRLYLIDDYCDHWEYI